MNNPAAATATKATNPVSCFLSFSDMAMDDSLLQRLKQRGGTNECRVCPAVSRRQAERGHRTILFDCRRGRPRNDIRNPRRVRQLPQEAGVGLDVRRPALDG